jgi:hypothetical protein
VCYRESQEHAGDALEAFAREVEDAGRMTEERQAMFKQLEKQTQVPGAQATQEGPEDSAAARNDPVARVSL